ncbi:MAG TPA: MmcQ/YjbR family DNA-binding protein [Bacteroidia bacterium]|nr:MmcQ/YjbR family DNA-binding protein [Bacteroidia bacterium]HNP99357.1 MmcQ/YjbR family DNA-binding protein [Bacteroidia bacterium]
MVTLDFVREFALSFEETSEQPHFEVTSFVVKKKIFATMNSKFNRACLRFSEIDQNVFCSIQPGVIYPVPNKWGKFGWTLVELKKVKKSLFKDALTRSYCTVAPAKLAAKYNTEF